MLEKGEMTLSGCAWVVCPQLDQSLRLWGFSALIGQAPRSPLWHQEWCPIYKPRIKSRIRVSLKGNFGSGQVQTHLSGLQGVWGLGLRCSHHSSHCHSTVCNTKLPFLWKHLDFSYLWPCAHTVPLPVTHLPSTIPSPPNPFARITLAHHLPSKKPAPKPTSAILIPSVAKYFSCSSSDPIS